MSWLTFHNDGIVVKKGPVDEELHRHRGILRHHRRLGINNKLVYDKREGRLKRLSYTESLLHLVQNRRGGPILRLCYCHNPSDSRIEMELLLIIAQSVDRVSQFLVHFRRLLLCHSSGLHRIVNDRR
jgi:hypothetical protein